MCIYTPLGSLADKSVSNAYRTRVVWFFAHVVHADWLDGRMDGLGNPTLSPFSLSFPPAVSSLSVFCLVACHARLELVGRHVRRLFVPLLALPLLLAAYAYLVTVLNICTLWALSFVSAYEVRWQGWGSGGGGMWSREGQPSLNIYTT